MKQRRPVIEGSGEVADMHHLRLMSLLQELERAHGRKQAAELLRVDRRTLDISLDEGVLSRRMRGALDKALQAGVGSAAAEQRDRNDRLEDHLDALEALVEELGKEMRVVRRATEDADRAIREEMSQAPRQSRGLHPIRAAARRWRADTRRGHTGPGALVRDRLLSCAADAPAFGLAGALSPVCAAVPAAKAGAGLCEVAAPVRPAVRCHPTGLRPHMAPGGLVWVLE